VRSVTNRLAFTWGNPDDDEQVDIAENMLRYWRYCREFVAKRYKERGDDLTSELLDAHDANPMKLSVTTSVMLSCAYYQIAITGQKYVTTAA